MSDQKPDDIEAAADAAKKAADDAPEVKRDDAPPDPKPKTATGKAPAKPKAAKKKKARKAASKKTAQPSGPEQAQIIAKARKDNAPPPPDPVQTDDEKAAEAEAELERREAVAEIVEAIIELTMRPLEEDETEEERAEAKADAIATLVDTARRGDTHEAAAECLARADEAQQAVVKLRQLHGELVTLAPPDDGRTHNERVKDVQKRSAEIRAQRVRDRLKLLAQGAGKSKLDQHLASQPRKSPADADKKTDDNKAE